MLKSVDFNGFQLTLLDFSLFYLVLVDLSCVKAIGETVIESIITKK